MQFNSYIFIMAFLPAMVVLYFASNKIHILAGKIVLILGSLFFYAYSDKKILMFLGASIAVNYLFAALAKNVKKRRIFIAFPIAVNVAFLLYFKYCNFAIENINILMKTAYEPRNIIIPIGISFITFQQIAYIVSIYKKELEKNDFIDYLVYILYFPKLIIGPLAEPVDFIRQINDIETKAINSSHIAEGLKMFSFGLFKKMVLADTFASAVLWGGV